VPYLKADKYGGTGRNLPYNYPIFENSTLHISDSESNVLNEEVKNMKGSGCGTVELNLNIILK
jgi:hypothetical protein